MGHCRIAFTNQQTLSATSAGRTQRHDPHPRRQRVHAGVHTRRIQTVPRVQDRHGTVFAGILLRLTGCRQHAGLRSRRGDDDARRIIHVLDDASRLARRRYDDGHTAEQAAQLAGGAGCANPYHAHALAAAMRAMPVDRRRSAPPAARHPITHAPQRAGAFRATSLRMAFHAAQRLLHAVRGDGQQHWPCLQGLRQHRHRGMRHAGAYARVGETRQLLAVQPPHPRHLIPASGWQRRDGCARAAHGSHGRVVLAFPLAQRATGVRQRHKHSPVRLSAQTHDAACLRVRHHPVSLLVRGIIHHHEQGRPLDRSIHGGTQSDDAPDLTGRRRQIGTVPFRRRQSCGQHDEVTGVSAVLGAARRETGQSQSLQGNGEILALSYPGQDHHGGTVLPHRGSDHPRGVTSPRTRSRTRIHHQGGERAALQG